MTVTARINVDTPSGRKIVRELEKHRKLVEIEYPDLISVDGIPVKTVSVNEVYERGLDKLSNHFNVNMRELKLKLK